MIFPVVKIPNIKRAALTILLALIVGAGILVLTGRPDSHSPALAALREPPGPGAALHEWPMFRGNPERTGVTRERLPLPLDLQWSYDAGEAIESSAAISQGTVFVGALDGTFHAVDLQTGKGKWKFQAGTGISSSPCVSEGSVYFGDEEGAFYALEAATGKLRWKFQTEAEIMSSPSCTGGQILFGSYDSNLYALSSRDGALLWKFQTEGRVHASPAIIDGMVLVTGCDGYVRILDISSGREVSRFEIGDYMGATPALDGDRLFVGTFGNQVYCINWKQEKLVWQYEYFERRFPFYSSAALTEKIMILGGRDRVVHALDRRTGEELWTFRAKGRVDSSPLVSGDTLFVGSHDGNLYALHIETGQLQWSFTAGGGLIASPAAASGRLVVGSRDGQLYCFGSKG